MTQDTAAERLEQLGDDDAVAAATLRCNAALFRQQARELGPDHYLSTWLVAVADRMTAWAAQGSPAKVDPRHLHLMEDPL